MIYKNNSDEIVMINQEGGKEQQLSKKCVCAKCLLRVIQDMTYN